MRVFAAIDLPVDIRESISEKAAEFKIKGITIVDKEVLHITLHFFGEMEEHDARRIEKTMKDLHADNFEVSIKGLSLFSPARPRVIFANVNDGSKEVTDLHKQLNGALGLQDKEAYIPHVTLARIRRIFDTGEITARIRKYSDYDFGSFTATSMALKRSTLTSDGPIHRTIAEIKL